MWSVKCVFTVLFPYSYLYKKWKKTELRNSREEKEVLVKKRHSEIYISWNERLKKIIKAKYIL